MCRNILPRCIRYYTNGEGGWRKQYLNSAVSAQPMRKDCGRLISSLWKSVRRNYFIK